MKTQIDIAREIRDNGCKGKNGGPRIRCSGGLNLVSCPLAFGKYDCFDYNSPVEAAKAYLQYNDTGDLSASADDGGSDVDKHGLPGEVDPNGIPAGDPGAKLDAGKIKAGVLADFRLAIMEVARVGSVRAEKYSRGGWQSVDNGIERYTDAAWRHLLSPEEYDNGEGGTGCLHEAQVIWNMLAALELRLRGEK